MKRKVIWSNLTDTGLEQLQLFGHNNEILADSVILGVEQESAFRIRYQIRCDHDWRVRGLTVKSLDENEPTIELNADGLGNWMNKSGERLSEFAGCLDVDITATPFTNTLPIRRLLLKQGESAEIKVVYLSIPEMQLSVEPQRYTCLEASEAGGRYLFESLDGDFSAIITVDSDKLVEDYPGLFKRVWRQ
jgi:hypothetical protein